jgi:hypothetical protein
MNWKTLLRSILKPKQYIKPKCPVCGKPLESFPGSAIQMCENGHKFGLGIERVDLINEGEHYGDL